MYSVGRPDEEEEEGEGEEVGGREEPDIALWLVVLAIRDEITLDRSLGGDNADTR